ncbi:hypothetical protein EDB86DRAFT_530848 [Lactarius hatsudake]|nr:hypothetical protein EDB86DRAFT_530848 [Lactarius hatsudake]
MRTHGFTAASSLISSVRSARARHPLIAFKVNQRGDEREPCFARAQTSFISHRIEAQFLDRAAWTRNINGVCAGCSPWSPLWQTQLCSPALQCQLCLQSRSKSASFSSQDCSTPGHIAVDRCPSAEVRAQRHNLKGLHAARLSHSARWLFVSSEPSCRQRRSCDGLFLHAKGPLILCGGPSDREGSGYGGCTLDSTARLLTWRLL